MKQSLRINIILPVLVALSLAGALWSGLEAVRCDRQLAHFGTLLQSYSLRVDTPSRTGENGSIQDASALFDSWAEELRSASASLGFMKENVDNLVNSAARVAGSEITRSQRARNEALAAFRQALEACRQQIAEESGRIPAGLIFFPLLGLAALTGLLLHNVTFMRRQEQLLCNYLDVPVERLLEESLPMPGKSLFDADLQTRLEQLLTHIRGEFRKRENFIAAMSHEIRTPMNGLVGFLSNLKETKLNDQQRQYLRIIESSARSLMHTLNEILDFSKIQSGRIELEDIAFDLKNFARERIALARQSARKPNLKLNLIFSGEEPVIIRSDPARLRQVLDNLLNNAVKFTERGEIILEISCTPADGNQLQVEFAVKDSGIGMTVSEQQRLFKPYEQAARSTARRYGGTGLGLAISHSLVRLLGGELTLQSRPGEGSRFAFTLSCPQARPEAQVHFSELHHVALPSSELRKHWALLVDDTPTNLFLLETICQSIGLPYRTAENGREALELCRQQHFDLIFMDIQMPIMDGYTAIREIRKLPDSATTAIVALTASAFQEDVDQALGAGSTGFIPKPFERDQLLLCIGESLGIAPIMEPRGTEDALDESPEAAVARRMHDFMREQYRISLGEIKMILAQTLMDWRPLLDNLMSYAHSGNEAETTAILQRLKGQLSAIGLAEHSEQCVTIMEAFREGRREEACALTTAFTQSLTHIFRHLEGDVTIPG